MKRKRKDYRKWAHSKKMLHLKRKNKRRKSFISRIIADTNIWLHVLKNNNDLYLKVKNRITPNYINLWEICNSGKLLSNPENAKQAFIKMVPLIGKGLFEQPLRYLTRIANKKRINKLKMKYEIFPKTNDMITMAKRLANGAFIAQEQEKKFYNHIIQEKEDMEKLKLFFREISQQCNRRIKDKEKHRQKSSIEQTNLSLNLIASYATDGTYDLQKLPRKDYELLLKTMDLYYKKLETGSLIWSRDDLYDLYILSYVRRGDKYWTKDKKWIELIKEAGCEKYLYDQEKN